MFLFRCCLRVDCGCQNEPETEASRSSHSSHDYLRPYDKQIQCRLLPQPVDTSSTKHFADYSGCSHTSTPRSILVGSTHSVDYEEVLLVSVSPGKQSDELIYASVNDSVICKPPCSSGIINDRFSPDTSTSNNNILPTDTNDNVKLMQDGGSDQSSDVSSASSGVDDDVTAEVRYVADIRQFRPTQTSIRPHGEECCCLACQSVSDLLVHHSSNLKCPCRSCRDFHNRMQFVNTNSGFTAGIGSNAFSNQYRLVSGVAQDGKHIPLTWSSKFSKVPESASSDSQNIECAHEDASVSVTHSGHVSGALASEVVDDDNELFSSDEELRYVFHKFIDDGSSEGTFIVSADDRLRLNVASSKLVQFESDAVQEYTPARSADDLEVAFFMVGNIYSDSPSAAVPDGSCVTTAVPALTAVSTERQTAVLEDIATSAAELTVHSFSIVTEPSAFRGHENLSAVQNGSEQYTMNIVCSAVETDSTFETNAGSGSPSELENLSGAFRIEESKMETDIYIDSDLNVPDSENHQTYPQLPSSDVRRDVIVQKLSDNSSFFIELPATDDEHISDASSCNTENVDISTAEHARDASVTQECSPGEDDVVVGQFLEFVTPECIIEHPVSVHDVSPSSQSAADVSYGHDNQFATAGVTSFIRDIIANAMQQIAGDAGNASMGICNVASENTSSEWPKQILITSAPLPCHWLAMEDEYDRRADSLPSTAAIDAEMQVTSETAEYSRVGTTDVSVFDTDVDHSSSIEAICMTGIEAQVVPQVEDYLISFDVSSQSQQPIVDEAGARVDQMPMQSSANKRIADDDHDDIKLEDLVRPLEHVASEGEQGADAGKVGSAVTFPPADIVEDFFMQYVLPVDSLGYSMETAATAVLGGQYADIADHPGVEQVTEDKIEVKQLENANKSDVICTVTTEGDINTHLEAPTTSAVFGMSYMVRRERDREQEDEKLKELATAAETVVDAVISDAIAETDAGVRVSVTADETSTATSADGDTQLVVPTRTSCLLQSPSEPHRKKSVHFADMHGLQLETVQHYHQSPEPDEPPASLEEFLSKLSAAAAERRAKWTEHHPSLVGGSWFCNSSIYLLACFELPGSQEELLERVRQHRVALESCSFDDLALAISGVVCVANVAFNKMVSVRYTVNHWTTHAEVDGEYIPRSNDGPTDRFLFTIILPSRKQFVIGSEAEFAIRYVAGDGPTFEFWDNNHGRNYVVRCCSKAASSDVDGTTNADEDCNENDNREG